ncbi:MAG: hypothetical protein JXR73_06980 [Candidatus Omnitrophica bacterium]|nr:hypothetical protein [Candidatus Omnitrophota bacterium]
MKRSNILILFGLPLLFTSCASPQFIAQPTQGATVLPSGKVASLSREGLTINASKTNSPSGLSDKITTFHVALINQTDHPIEFIPHLYLLFDQNNRQHLALTKPDLTEAAARASRPPYGAASWGFGVGSFHRSSIYSFHYYSDPFWIHDPWFDRRTYQGILARSLPIHPFTVYPHAIVEGDVHFVVKASSLVKARLQITRLTRIPEKESPAREIPYIFDFNVVK